ncbi:MAG TPA: iron ABC transporter permease [Anaerolineaceae bacterium]|nr:iron ABC transporter permease [Anaerolineaceae bacterium]
MSWLHPIRSALTRSGILLWGLPLALLIGFFFFPMASILGVMFERPGSIILRDVWQPLGFTVYQALLSTLLTLLFGLPVAYVFARFDFTGKRLMRTLTMLPFILPTVVTAAAFNALLGPRGWVNLFLMNITGAEAPPITFLNTFTAILVAHVFYNIAIIIRVVGSAWSQLDPRLEQSARVLGASPWKAFREVTLPLLQRPILSAALLVFLFDFASFGVILMLGGPAYQTLEVAIYTQALHYLNLPMAGLLSLIQLSCTLVVMLIYGKVNRGQQVQLFPRLSGEGTRKPRTAAERWIVTLTVVFLFLLQVLPLGALVARSVTRLEADRGQRGAVQTGLTLDYYRELFVNQQQSIFYVPPINAVVNSLEYAGITMVISVTTGTLLAYALVKKPAVRRWLDPLIMLPFGASTVTLGLGFVVAFNSSPLARGSFPWLVPLAHSLIAMPFVLRAIQPALASIPASIRQSAAVLGASPFHVWWNVEMKLISRALLSGALFSFTISLGEFGATSFISRPDNPTLPVAIFRYLSQPGAMNYGQAMAMATILILVCALSLTLLENLSHALVKSD